MSRIKLMNIEIDNLTMDEALYEMERLIERKTPSFVVTPNVDHLVKIEKGSRLAEAYKKADLILTDGKPLIWASKLLGEPIKEKVSGSDVFPRVCQLAEKKGYSVFLLGAAEGVAKKASENLIKQFPELKIAGVYSPPVGFENDSKEINKTVDTIREAEPDILIVCLGTPKQELFILDHLDRLHVPLSLGLGASLDFASGVVKRAPKWMSDCGFEWLYRLCQNPRRLWKRYFVDDLYFITMLFSYR